MNATKPFYPDGDRPTLFEEGLQFQDYIADLFMQELGIALTSYSSKEWQCMKGENRQGIEIKLDRRILETGNVSIEVAEKSRADIPTWTDSGIMRDDNAWLYVQGNRQIVFVFAKKILRMLYLTRYQDRVRAPKPTIKAFLMPVSVAKKYALKVFEIPENNS